MATSFCQLVYHFYASTLTTGRTLCDIFVSLLCQTYIWCVVACCPTPDSTRRSTLSDLAISYVGWNLRFTAATFYYVVSAMPLTALLSANATCATPLAALVGFGQRQPPRHPTARSPWVSGNASRRATPRRVQRGLKHLRHPRRVPRGLRAKPAAAPPHGAFYVGFGQSQPPRHPTTRLCGSRQSKQASRARLCSTVSVLPRRSPHLQPQRSPRHPPAPSASTAHLSATSSPHPRTQRIRTGRHRPIRARIRARSAFARDALSISACTSVTRSTCGFPITCVSAI